MPYFFLFNNAHQPPKLPVLIIINLSESPTPALKIE